MRPGVETANWVALGTVPFDHTADTKVGVGTECVSLRSTSVNAIVPEVVSAGVSWPVWLRSSLMPLASPDVITGASLVPVIVIVTGRVEIALSSSLTVTS